MPIITFYGTPMEFSEERPSGDVIVTDQTRDRIVDRMQRRERASEQVGRSGGLSAFRRQVPDISQQRSFIEAIGGPGISDPIPVLVDESFMQGTYDLEKIKDVCDAELKTVAYGQFEAMAYGVQTLPWIIRAEYSDDIPMYFDGLSDKDEGIAVVYYTVINATTEDNKRIRCHCSVEFIGVTDEQPDQDA